MTREERQAESFFAWYDRLRGYVYERRPGDDLVEDICSTMVVCALEYEQSRQKKPHLSILYLHALDALDRRVMVRGHRVRLSSLRRRYPLHRVAA